MSAAAAASLGSRQVPVLPGTSAAAGAARLAGPLPRRERRCRLSPATTAAVAPQAHVPAVVLHALVFRLPFPAALATNGLAVALFIAFGEGPKAARAGGLPGVLELRGGASKLAFQRFSIYSARPAIADPAVCKGGHTLCAAGSAAKQRLAAWLRQRLGTWLIKPAGDAGWQGLLAECTRVQAWWQLCALAAAMQLVWCRERVERLAWVKRQEATDADHAAALSAAARRLERAARPASRVLLELAVSAVAAWLLVDMLL